MYTYQGLRLNLGKSSRNYIWVTFDHFEASNILWSSGLSLKPIMKVKLV